MKNIATLAILLFLFVGMAGAGTPVTLSKIPTFTQGPSNGFKNGGTIQAGDLYATDDLIVGDDTWNKGDMTVNGTLRVGVFSSASNVTSGSVTDDLTIADGTDITAATGAEAFNYAASTALFYTGTGANHLNGDVTIANGKDFAMTGAGTFATGTGRSDILGSAVIAGSSYQNATRVTSLVASGTSYLNATRATTEVLSGRGYFNGTQATSIYSSGGLNVAGTSALNATTVSTFAASGKANIIGALTTTTTAKVGGTATVNALVDNGTAVIAGATYLNATTLGGAMAYSVNASTTVSTTRTDTGTKTVFGIDAHSANVTLTLPDAATVPGRVYQIGTNVDPGSYYVKIKATTSDKLGGSGGFTIAQTTDAKAGMALVSDGTLYLIYGAYGTWAEGTA